MYSSLRWVKYSFLFIIAALTGCLEREESDFEKLLKADEQEISNYLQSKNLEATKTSSGIYYTTLKENDNGKKVAFNDIISIKYSMSTLAGKHIDSAIVTAEGKPIKFKHVDGGLLPVGMNMGINMMREGEAYRFYIPSAYAYYSYAYKDVIPANAILVTDVEILKIEKQSDINAQDKLAILNYIEEHQLENIAEQDSGFFFQSLKAGAGEVPKARQIASVSYKGLYLNDSVFNQSKAGEPFKFVLGSGNIIPGFEQGVAMMKKGEKARVIMPSRLAYKEGVQILPEVIRKDYLQKNNMRDNRPFTPLIFEIELLDIQ